MESYGEFIRALLPQMGKAGKQVQQQLSADLCRWPPLDIQRETPAPAGQAPAPDAIPCHRDNFAVSVGLYMSGAHSPPQSALALTGHAEGRAYAALSSYLSTPRDINDMALLWALHPGEDTPRLRWTHLARSLPERFDMISDPPPPPPPVKAYAARCCTAPWRKMAEADEDAPLPAPIGRRQEARGGAGARALSGSRFAPLAQP